VQQSGEMFGFVLDQPLFHLDSRSALIAYSGFLSMKLLARPGPPSKAHVDSQPKVRKCFTCVFSGRPCKAVYFISVLV
jgi:hypothetical protein